MSRRLAVTGLAGTLVLLLAHALFYRFLCDDAFISFRYARNLADGYGLVFNPGQERVEGYTNFLWVVVLAGLDRAGIRPEEAAPALGLVLTAALWVVVARAAWRLLPLPYSIFPPLGLAVTRSVAVWSTSGLETRLFEVLLVAGVLRVAERERPDVPAAVLLALASLTRPDGILVSASALAATMAWRALARPVAIYVTIVGAHVLFRFLYYGAWLPNTYHAKVGGHTWWGMGATYLACFAVEYAVVLWLPLLVLGARGFATDARRRLPLVFAAAVLPHALYVVSIGGDHFEYRPLDLYFPFAFLIMARGLRALAARMRTGAVAYAGAVVVGLVALPWAAHAQFPPSYQPGYPGRARAQADRDGFLDLAWPGARLHRRLLDTITERVVGVREEEHVQFLAGVVPQGRALARLVERGLLPADTHIAIGAVGAIPYYSGLRTLDRLGLTDAEVARQAPASSRFMAHNRYATLAYAARAGVDLWSIHPYLLVLPLDDGTLLWHIDVARADGSDVYIAEVGDESVLVALLPGGSERASARFPKLKLRPASDAGEYAAFLDLVVAACRARADREPGSLEAKRSLAMALNARGASDEALAVFRELAAAGDAEGWYNAGTILAGRGEFGAAIDALRRAVALDPSTAPARHNLGMALARTGQFAEALVELREAVRLEPESPGALFALGAVALGAGDREEAQRCRKRLLAMGTPEAGRLADRLGEGL